MQNELSNRAEIESALALIDKAVAAGDLIVDEAGSPRPANEGQNLAALDRQREERHSQIDSDATDQERIILGQVLAGQRDNSSKWAKFRSTLGLAPGQAIPDHLWSEGPILRIAQEIDEAFNGRRDIKQLNGAALIEGYRLMVERGRPGSLQNFSVAIQTLISEAGSFVENDFLIAIEILQSKRARGILSNASWHLERSLRGDRPVEEIVKALSVCAANAQQIVKGRLGDDLEFDSFESLHDLLLSGMEAEKAEPISTGIRALDIDLGGGVNPALNGKLHTIAARTGVGKTTVAIAAAMGLTLRGTNTLFLSCELDGIAIGARAMSNFAAHNKLTECKSWILEGRGHTRKAPGQYNRLRELWTAQQQLGNIGDFKSKALFHASAEDFAEYIYSAKSKDPNLVAVFLDHFHALKPSKGFNNRSQEMEARILFLHQVAKQCKVDLFLCAQLNRDACMAIRPTLAHINGTDAIGQLSHCCWLLEFPKREEGAVFDSKRLICYHAKFRDGQRDSRGNNINEEETELTISREYCYVTG